MAEFAQQAFAKLTVRAKGKSTALKRPAAAASLLVATVRWQTFQQQKGVERFHCPAKNIGQEKEVPEEEEEEVIAILSRGMQQPKMALLGAWGAQLQLARKKALAVNALLCYLFASHALALYMIKLMKL